MTNAEIVRAYFEGWSTGNRDLLRLADDFRHESPMAVHESAQAFLDDCWHTAGHAQVELERVAADGEDVVARHTIQLPHGPFPVCEWFRVRDGLIRDCRVYFDRTLWQAPPDEGSGTVTTT
jgi:ketosteroid isomerase-like protein